MRIAVIGSGIGGMATVVFLARQGHEITLFDQFETPLPVGSGLVLQPTGQRIMDLLGLGEKCRDTGAKIFRMVGHEVSSGQNVLNVPYGPEGGSFFGLAMYRADLFDILFSAVKSCGVEICTNCRVVDSYLHNQKRWVCSTNGDKLGPFDLVVDASGSNSCLSPLIARPLTYGALWGTVNWPDNTKFPQDQLRQKYRRATNMIGVMPITSFEQRGHKKATIFWSLPQASYESWRSKPLSNWIFEAITLWPEIEPFVEQVQHHEDLTMARYSHGTLLRPYADRIVYIGDSAHRASPQLGQGANMALLDAYALTQSVQQHTLSEALPAFARTRRRHIGLYQMFSYFFTPLYQSDSRTLACIRDWVLAPLSRLSVSQAILTRLVCGDLIAPMRGFE